MEYISIKELSAKFAIPERTVYYRVKRNPLIGTEQEGKKVLVNVADFAKAYNIPLQPLQKTETEVVENGSTTLIAELQESNSKLQESNSDLQKEVKGLVSEKDILEKRNLDLVSDNNKYALAVKEEKNEKKEWIVKYDTLQGKVEIFMQRYYLLLWLCIALIFILLFLSLPQILENYFGSRF